MVQQELEEKFAEGKFSWDGRRTTDAATLLKQFLRFAYCSFEARQMSRQTDRQTDRHVGDWRDGWMVSQMDKHLDRQSRQTDIKRYRHVENSHVGADSKYHHAFILS